MNEGLVQTNSRSKTVATKEISSRGRIGIAVEDNGDAKIFINTYIGCIA